MGSNLFAFPVIALKIVLKNLLEHIWFTIMMVQVFCKGNARQFTLSCKETINIYDQAHSQKGYNTP